MPDPRLQIEAVDVAAEARRRRKRLTAVAVAAVVVIAAGAGLGWYLTPPPVPTTFAEAEALVASARFQRLSDAQKQPYLDRINEQFGSLDRDTRRQMMAENEELRQALRENRRNQFMEQIRAWNFASAEERAAMAGAFPWGGGRPGGGGPPSDRDRDRDRPGDEESDAERDRSRGDRMRGRINDRAVNGNAQDGAFMGEFFRSRRGD